MELILISNTKLKIMLNESDMQKYSIGSDCDCAEASTRKAIRSLLECAKEQIGFNTSGEEIFVQLYTSRDGGCELFVTKCAAEKEANEINESLKRLKSPILSEDIAREKKTASLPSLPPRPSVETEIRPTEKEKKRLPKPREERRSRIAFSFSSLADLISVCRILAASDISPESRAFADEDGNYYLLLLDTGMSAYSRLDKLTFILEYGKRENPDCLVSYISEHGKTVCAENAVETLARF